MTDTAKPGGWTAGKIILVVVLVLAGLGLVCCGAGWFFIGSPAMQLGTDMAAFGSSIQTEFGKNATISLEMSDPQNGTVLVGVKEELTPERVAEIQDKAWKAYAAAFGEHGGLPVKQLAVGRAGKKVKGGQSGAQGTVSGWHDHVVPVEEIVKRTGIAAPPLNALMKMAQQQQQAQMQQGDETEPADDGTDGSPEKKEDQGGKPDGK